MVAAPGAGKQLAVDRLRVAITTDTSSRIESYFKDGATTTAKSMFRTLATLTGTADGVALDVELNPPWILAENSALAFDYSCTAASTGAVEIQAGYRIKTI